MVKYLPANAGDVKDSSLIPGLGRSPRGGAWCGLVNHFDIKMVVSYGSS